MAIPISPFAKGIDINNAGPDVSLKISLENAIRPNILTSVNKFKGIILRKEPDIDTNQVSTGFLSKLGIRTTAKLKAYKIRVTSPENFDADKPLTEEDFNKLRNGVDAAYYNTIIDLHRTFIAQDESVKEAGVGEEVWIDFGTLDPISEPIYLGPISNTASGNGSVSAEKANSPTEVVTKEPQPQALTNADNPEILNGDINRILPEPYLTLPIFKAMFPSAPNPQYHVDLFNEVFKKYSINTPAKVCSVLAQCAHESGQFRYLVEFASGEAYEGRKNLGNINEGDGPLFKGRGFIQITGRANYDKYGKLLKLDLITTPALATDRKVAAELAVLYFKDKGLISLAEQNNFKEITRRINGGYNGYADRIKHYKASLKQFGVDVQV